MTVWDPFALPWLPHEARLPDRDVLQGYERQIEVMRLTEHDHKRWPKQAVWLADRENGTVSPTEPLFATGLGEDLIISDLPVPLLPEETRELLARLVSFGENLDALADFRFQE